MFLFEKLLLCTVYIDIYDKIQDRNNISSGKLDSVSSYTWAA